MEVTRRLLQESYGLVPWVGLAESSLVTEWVPRDWKWSRAVGEAGRVWGSSRLVGVCCWQSLGVSVLGGLKPQL